MSASSTEALAGVPAPAVLRIALTHPMQVWVDALDSALAPRWDIEVAAAHTDPAWVRHSVLTEPVDLLLLHLTPEQSEALDMVPDLVAQRPGLGVIGLSDSHDRALLRRAVRCGVRGWLEPGASVDHLVRVMHGVAQRETWIPPKLMTPLLDVLLAARDRQDETSSALSKLSARELEVLRCLAQGLSRHDIAEHFFLSPHTVRTHINRLLRKLDVHSTLAAVALARQAGLTEEPPPA